MVNLIVVVFLWGGGGREVLISQSASNMFQTYPLNYGVYTPAFKFVVGMCQIMMVEGLAVTICQ